MTTKQDLDYPTRVDRQHDIGLFLLDNWVDPPFLRGETSKGLVKHAHLYSKFRFEQVEDAFIKFMIE